MRTCAVAIDRCDTFPGVIGVASPMLSPGALPGRCDLGGGSSGRHGPEPDGAARTARGAGAHAPAGAAGGVSTMRADSESDAVGVLDRMTAILEAFDEDDHGLRHLGARGASRPAEVDGLATRLHPRAPALPRARRKSHPSRTSAVRARTARRSAARAEGRRASGHGRPAQHDGRDSVIWRSAMGARWCASPSCAAARRRRRPRRIGGRIPAHATALGKAVLAHSDAGDIDAVVAADLASWTPHTITDPRALGVELADIRRSGARDGGRRVRRRCRGRREPRASSPSGALAGAIVGVRARGRLRPGAARARPSAAAQSRSLDDSRPARRRRTDAGSVAAGRGAADRSSSPRSCRR